MSKFFNNSNNNDIDFSGHDVDFGGATLDFAGATIVGFDYQNLRQVECNLGYDITPSAYTAPGEDIINTFTIPANLFDTDGTRVVFDQVISTAANANNKQFRWYLGGGIFFDTGVLVPNNRIFLNRITVIRDSAITARFTIEVKSEATAGVPYFQNYYSSTFPLIFSGTIALVTTAECIANSDAVHESITGKVIRL